MSKRIGDPQRRWVDRLRRQRASGDAPAGRGKRSDCPIDSLEANVDPPDRTPDLYRRALASCPFGCNSDLECTGHRAWR